MRWWGWGCEGGCACEQSSVCGGPCAFHSFLPHFTIFMFLLHVSASLHFVRLPEVLVWWGSKGSSACKQRCIVQLPRVIVLYIVNICLCLVIHFLYLDWQECCHESGITWSSALLLFLMFSKFPKIFTWVTVSFDSVENSEPLRF